MGYLTSPTAVYSYEHALDHATQAHFYVSPIQLAGCLIAGSAPSPPFRHPSFDHLISVYLISSLVCQLMQISGCQRGSWLNESPPG